MCTSRRALCGSTRCGRHAPTDKAGDQKDQEDKFCKTISPKQHKICGLHLLAAAQSAWLRQYRCESLEEPDQDTRDIGISFAVRKFVAGRTVTRNYYLTGRQLESSLRSASGKGNRCRPCWTSRFPDPEGRESVTPFPCWLCVHLYPSWWHRHSRLTPRGTPRGPGVYADVDPDRK
jgi:hypothetical protein